MKLPIVIIPLLMVATLSLSQQSMNVQLVYHWEDTSLPSTFAHNNTYNEIWGLAEGGREYAVIGSTMGTHIFDITDPSNVDTAIFIPGAATGTSIVHRDFHDYNGYLYIVCDEDSQQTLSTLQIVDLSYLPDSAPVVYNSNALFRNSHNIFIDSTNARLYACGVRPSFNPLEIYDLTDPVNPVLIETYNRGGHDVYVRNDTAYLNDGYQGFFAVDFETPGNPISLGNITSYTDSGYNHSGWLSEDGNVYALADENFGLSIKLLDVSDLSNMSVLSTISSGVDPLSIPHNLIIKGAILYASYYNDGLYLFNISDPLNPIITGYYDTSTEPHVNGNYRGAWGVYPFLPSGLVLVSDMQTGLYVLDASGAICDNPTGSFSSSIQNLTVSFLDGSAVAGSATYNWEFGDGNSSVDQNPTHTYSGDGTYTVCLGVTDSCGTDTVCAQVTVVLSIGINSKNMEPDWWVAPNPFSNGLTVFIPMQYEGLIEYRLYGFSGKRVASGTGFSQYGKMGLPGAMELLPGMYLLELRTEDHVLRKKIIKSHELR